MCELTTEQVRALDMLVEFTQTMRRHGCLDGGNTEDGPKKVDLASAITDLAHYYGLQVVNPSRRAVQRYVPTCVEDAHRFIDEINTPVVIEYETEDLESVDPVGQSSRPSYSTMPASSQEHHASTDRFPADPGNTSGLNATCGKRRQRFSSHP